MRSSTPAKPPRPSRGVLSDIYNFFVHRPARPTLIEFATEDQRENYSQRIMQRLGIRVGEYSVFNVHKIGVDAPAQFVFEELLKWDGDSTCWPNHIAEVERQEDRIERIRIFLFGWRRYPMGVKKGTLGLRFIPLFNLSAARIQHLPGPLELDSARYILYETGGGYPIGVFAMYVRSSIAAQAEAEPAQLFIIVGFDFYGKKQWREANLLKRLANRLWEAVHNRVTANTMNRMKQVCEWKFRRLCEGRSLSP